MSYWSKGILPTNGGSRDLAQISVASASKFFPSESPWVFCLWVGTLDLLGFGYLSSIPLLEHQEGLPYTTSMLTVPHKPHSPQTTMLGVDMPSLHLLSLVCFISQVVT